MSFEKQIKVVGIGGSRRKNSLSMRALEIACDGALTKGASVQMFSVSELNLAPYEPNNPTIVGSNKVQEYIHAIREAACLIWSAPAYHGVMSGDFKNVIDHIDLLQNDRRPFLTNRIVAFIGVGSGATASVTTVASMITTANALRAIGLPYPACISFADDNFLTDAEFGGYKKKLTTLGEQAVVVARKMT
jgi:FMN reductase